MERYLFDFDEDRASQPNEHSLDFPTFQTAYSEAVRALSEIMAEKLPSYGHGRYLAITARDAVTAAIFRASLRFDSQAPSSRLLDTLVTRVEGK
ncbi:hypothetical protein [Phreatobacter sp.]|uniref:DUF6894 family protein n=1 Tax=Phreatobacter sp. TaxID=1966341 RepID=UPI0025D0BDA9|nr:hypothetical protein [Phreatobacter sp.]